MIDAYFSGVTDTSTRLAFVFRPTQPQHRLIGHGHTCNRIIQVEMYNGNGKFSEVSAALV